MELLYLYIKRYDDVFENQQINFSSNYNIEYKDGCLNIEYKNNNMKGYYGDNIKNSTSWKKWCWKIYIIRSFRYETR